MSTNQRLDSTCGETANNGREDDEVREGVTDPDEKI